MLVLYLLLFVLPATVYGLLRSPSVQQYLCDVATSYLSKEMGAKITVGGVNVAFFLDLVLEDVVIEDKHKNTILYAPRIRADIDDIDIGNKKLNLGKVELDGAFIALMKYKNEKKLNLQFLVDYFKSGDTATKKNAPWGINIDAISLRRYTLRLRRPERTSSERRNGLRIS